MTNEKKSLIDKIFGLTGKKEWRELEKRSKQLPEEYRQAYKKMQTYMWNTGVVNAWPQGRDAFSEILDFLEEAVVEGKSVNDKIGPDVAAFCDAFRLKDSDWRTKQREKLNRKIGEL